MGLTTTHVNKHLLKCVEKFVKHHVKKLTDEEYSQLEESVGGGWFDVLEAYTAYIKALPETRAKYMTLQEFGPLLNEVMACKYGVLPWANDFHGFRPFKLI